MMRKIPMTGAVILLSLLIWFSFCVGDAWARAGGGGGYRSGGSFHSSGGGFHSGGGTGFYGGGIPLNATTISIVLIVLLLIIATKTVNDGYRNKEARLIRNTRRNADLQDLLAGKAGLVARDPDFNEAAFLEQVKTIFTRVQEAWAAQSVAPVRHLVSDGIFERYALQLEMMKNSGVTNLTSNLKIGEAVIAAVESDACFDAVDVYIRASAVDRYVELKTGNVVCGGTEPEEFAEYWTFLRRPGAKTLHHPGLGEDCCPNCGAPLQIVDRCECGSCHAIVNSGDYDWVLTEITQDSEWQYHPPRAVAGVEELRNADPAFNLRHLEDRVSVMFYRWIAAQFMADPRYLRKLAAPGFMTANEGMFRTQADGSRLFYADAAVGTVETVEVVPGEGSESRDLARVKVKWSGHRLQAKVPGVIIPDYDQSRLFLQEFLLERHCGVKSSDRNVLSSSHCPNCGAPETMSDRAVCEYCQTPLNDGSRDWVLTEIRPFSGMSPLTAAPSPADEQLSGIAFFDERDGESLVIAAAALMLADGEISDREMQLLRRFAAQRRIVPARLETIIASLRGGELEIPLPSDRAATLYFLRCLVLMCLADGKITPPERKLLCTLGGNMKITFKEVETMIRDERRRLLEATNRSTEEQD